MILLALVLASSLSEAPELSLEISPWARLTWVRGELPVLWLLPRRGEGFEHLAKRYCGGATKAGQLARANPLLRQPLQGVRVRVPWELLNPLQQREVLTKIFPKDLRTPEGWMHRVVGLWEGEPESWWELALWFTGDGGNYRQLMQANPQVPLFPPLGASIVIPESLLLPTLKDLPVKTAEADVPQRPASQAPTPTPKPALAPPTPIPPPGQPKAVASPPAGIPQAKQVEVLPGVFLEYEDQVAVYRLAPGEALYSSVVVRFTGLLHAADVNATAAKLADLSGIKDVTAIPVGHPIRIPVDLLLPEYLPVNHPRRREWEKERESLTAIRRVLRAAQLEGIHVILDAGHGGADTGAVVGGVWEATYTYDVMLRLKRALERDTKATVWLLVKDPLLGDSPPEKDEIQPARKHTLLTNPPYELQDATNGVHLRWVLANALLRKLQGRGVDPERIVFMSIHADSLHPAVRGLMVYVPGRKFRPNFAKAPSYLPRVAELSSGGRVRFDPGFSARSEAFSWQLAESLVSNARRFGLPVHAFDPIRSHVIRGGRAWVPAVLRFSAVPTAVLVEMVNLNNEEDRRLLLSWRFREKLAHALAAGLAEAFSR
ncbi:MAG: N-acetylmuramoyl-L-alanine amidase family protein [Thermoanaerobaculaceae bacterium]